LTFGGEWWIFRSFLGRGMNRAVLTDEQWGLILPFLMAHSRVYVGAQAVCRRYLDAVLWILRSGAQWRFLPRDLGAWNSIFKRFARWCQRGVWADLQAHVAAEPDLQEVLIDSTIVRAHACAAGARGSTAEDEALGRSRGGFTTKIHALTDALGNPLKFILTGGQASDIGQADQLLEGIDADAVLGDKGYDADRFVQTLAARGVIAVIPPRANRNDPRPCDWHVYKERHLIECFFGKIKHYRRVFSRFEKTACHFMGFLHYVATLVWTR
jgi:transposase